jgi:hypothetical protein
MSIAFSCDAQILDSLPPDSILYKNLATYHQSLVTAQLSEFEISAKGNWMNYVPSVGVGYAPSGEPRPTMSFSLSQIFTAQRNREIIEAKRRAITATATLLYQSEIRKLQALLHQFQIIQSDIRFANSIHQIDIQLFQFYETQHRNSEITASQFLLKKRDMLTKEQNIKKIETSLEDKRLEIMEASY